MGSLTTTENLVHVRLCIRQCCFVICLFLFEVLHTLALFFDLSIQVLFDYIDVTPQEPEISNLMGKKNTFYPHQYIPAYRLGRNPILFG